MMFKCCVVFGVLAITTCFANESVKIFTKNCNSAYSLTCLKLDIVSWVDKLNEDDDYNVLPGVSIVKENNTSPSNTAELVAELGREFPDDPEARLDAFLMKKVTGFVNNHSIKLNFWKEQEGEARRGGGGGGFGGNKGGGGGMGYLLAAGAMMKGTLFALAMGGLAALAGKALMAAMISLLLSAISALKGSGSSVSHEDGGHGHSGYGRSFDDPLPLALQPGYKLA